MSTYDEDRFQSRSPQSEMRTTSAIGLIGGSSYIGLVLGIVRSIFVMRLIGPRGRGVQRLAAIWKGYLSNVSMPWRSGLNKELPISIGAEDCERAAEVEDAGFFATAVFTALAAVGMVFYAMFISTSNWEHRVAFAIGGGLLLAEDMASLYWSALRSWGRFHLLAVAEIVRSVVYLGLMVGGAWLLDVTGVMLGWLAAGLLVLAYLDVTSRIGVRVRVNWPQVWSLARIGLPVAIVSFADVLLRTVDGLVLERYYGAEQFGLYTLAMQMATYLFNLPRAAGFVIWPRVLQSYGGDDAAQKRRRVLLPTVGMAGAMPVIGGVAWLMLPWMVAAIVPDFLPAVPSAQILSLGATALALPMATDAALVANDREPVVIATKTLGALVAGGGVWYVVTHGGTLQAVAAAACAGFGLAAVLSLWIKLGEFEPRRHRRLGEVALALAPTAWVIGALWVVERLVPWAGLGLSTLAGAVVAVLAFLVLTFPCLLYAHRRTGVGADVRRIIRNRLGR
ncbi:MAG: lipopolysaccharide biosynthesis protein [Armatimonadota bacterium]|jgi:O-antigen/teichoic acid export membrane protein